MMHALHAFEGWQGLDVVALAVVAVAVARGTIRGVVREAFSLGAIAVAFIVARFATAPLAAWLVESAPMALPPWAATSLAGIAVVGGSLIGVGLLGRTLRTGVHAAGLGLFDRLAGALLGAGEGALVVAVGVALAAAAVGPDHAALRQTKTLAAYDAAMDLLGRDRLADVAAPPMEVRR